MNDMPQVLVDSSTQHGMANMPMNPPPCAWHVVDPHCTGPDDVPVASPPLVLVLPERPPAL